MKRLARFALAALALVAGSRTAFAQDATNEGFFGKPAFVLMPGAVITPVLSGVGDQDAGPTKTYFNARFMTVVPTALPWFQMVAGAQFLPNGPNNRVVRQNQPHIFYGAIIPFAALTEATNGWFSVSLDPLGLYSLGGGGGGRDVYGHDFVLEGAVVANVGQKMMTNMGFFSSSSIYVLLDQVLTHRPIDPATGDKDYWNPVALAGVVIPIGR
jgi:hypothetical protein